MPNLPKPRLRRPRRGGLRWVNIEHPGALERAGLEEHFDFHALDLEDVLSRNQRPKIDNYDDYLFSILNLPVFDRSAKRLRAGERLLFLCPGYLGTIPDQPLCPGEY